MTGGKKYQVFVSSTFRDLLEARMATSLALLQLGCIPEGMESFAPSDKDQWQTIRESIDGCAFYVVIAGGRYGTIVPETIASNSEGLSFTEMEYRYAKEQGIPVLPFLHKSPESLLTGDKQKEGETDEKRKKLQEFRAKLETEKTPGHWGTKEELRTELRRGLSLLLGESKRPYWVRSDISAMQEAQSALQAKVKEIVRREGKKKITIRYSLEISGNNGIDFTWNDVFCRVLFTGMVVGGIPGYDVRSRIDDLLTERVTGDALHGKIFVNDASFEKIMVKFLHLEWLTCYEDADYRGNDVLHWKLTPEGKQAMQYAHEFSEEHEQDVSDDLPF